jgi:nifR3 family TIM-barrel protein
MKNFWKNLKKPITLLAPMDDITDFVFREIISDIAKPDVLYTEFTCVDALCSKGKEKAMENLMLSEKQKPVVAQIWGSDAKNFGNAAELIEQLGFNGIDINMGCPDKSVLTKNAGAALIGNIELAGTLISAVKNSTKKIPLSVKTRIAGTPEETEEWFAFLLKQDIQALVIHGRTGKQMYRGSADWEQIGNAVKLKNKINPDIILVGNGDVKSYEEVMSKHTKYGVDGVMIGRGALLNPWVFDKSVAPTARTVEEGVKLLLKHAALYNETWKDTRNFQNIKKFVKMYVNNFRGADRLRCELMSCKDYACFTEVSDKFCQDSLKLLGK